MKHLCIIAAIILLLAGQAGAEMKDYGGGGLPGFSSSGTFTTSENLKWASGKAPIIPSYTVATLPTPVEGMRVQITDGASASDCTTGSGSTKVSCIYRGSAWEADGSASVTPASTAEVAAGTVENKYVNPKELKVVTDGKVSTSSAATYTQPDADNKLVGRTGDGKVGVVTVPVGLTLTSSAHTGSTNTIKQIKYLTLTNPQYCDETGAKLNITKTDGAKFGQCAFADDADKAGNYAIYELTVPPDIDTAVDLTARIYYRLGGADTATHTYTLSVSSVAASSSSAGSFGQEITFNSAADASGADGDIEITPALASAMTTLTDWKSNVTAGQVLLIKLARDGDAGGEPDADASTTDSYSNKVVISYGSTQ